MSDYWVKPTIEQLQAELEWERGQEKIRRKRRNILGVVMAVAVLVAAATAIFPGGGIQHMKTGYAMEETVEPETETAPQEDAEGQIVVEGIGK